MENKQKRDLFISLVQSLISNATVYLGLQKNPLSEKEEVNLDQASYVIDMLQMIYEKTKGNLEQSENDFLERSLSELKMQYLKIKN